MPGRRGPSARLPWAPVDDYVRRRFSAESAKDQAAWLMVNQREIHRARTAGSITVQLAERICDTVREHPTTFWGREYLRLVRPDGRFVTHTEQLAC